MIEHIVTFEIVVNQSVGPVRYGNPCQTGPQLPCFQGSARFFRMGRQNFCDPIQHIQVSPSCRLNRLVHSGQAVKLAQSPSIAEDNRIA
ncbi:hypothetical protein D3C81_1926900 [compost metagenome]